MCSLIKTITTVLVWTSLRDMQLTPSIAKVYEMETKCERMAGPNQKALLLGIYPSRCEAGMPN